jgi:hypothetical protein
MLCFHEGARPSVLSITTHHHVAFHRVRPHKQPSRGTSLQASITTHHVVATKGTSSVLSITTHHHVVFSEARPSVLSITTHHHCANRARPPCYQSSPFSRKARPPCYQSQLIIMLFFTSARPPCYQSQPHHHVVGVLRAINHNSSSCCVFTKGTSLRAINHNSSSCCFHERGTSLPFHATQRHVPPCYQSQLIIMLFHERGTSLRAITTHHHCFHEGTSSVLSINLSRCVFSRESVPPCYQSQLIIMLCFQHVPPCYQSQLIIMLWFHEGTSLRAINHNSSSCCVNQ